MNPTPVSLLVPALAALAGPAPCQGVQDVLRVHAKVPAQCEIQAQNLDFGLYSALTGATASTFVSVRCTPGIRSLLTLDGGRSGSIDDRRMTGPGQLTYHLYRDNPRRERFGQQRSEAVVVEADGRWDRVPVYGEIPKGQNVPPGDYSDVVSATLYY